MFAYCLNNPIGYSDSSGYIPTWGDPASLQDCATGGGVIIGYALLSKFNTKKPINLPSRKKVKLDMDHISSGHMPNGNRNPDGRKTVFWGLTTNQVIKAIYEAYETSSKLRTQGERIMLIGYSSSYNLTIELWLNTITKYIETAYPK